MPTTTERTSVRMKTEEKGIVIEKVLLEVQRALQNARTRTADAGFPELKVVTLTLQTVITKGVGGKIKFLIFSFGRTWEQEKSHQMVLRLTPPPPAPQSLGPPKLSEELANAIVDAAQGVRKARSGDPPLLLDTFDLSLSFVVTLDDSGGLEFKLEPVSFELKGNLKSKALHRIELSFKNK